MNKKQYINKKQYVIFLSNLITYYMKVHDNGITFHMPLCNIK